MTMIGPCGSCGNRSVVSKELWARSVRPQLRQLPSGDFASRIDGPDGGRRVCRVRLFKSDRRFVIERRMTTPRVVPAFGEVEDGGAQHAGSLLSVDEALSA